ncbi:MAG: hypothetical protein IT324_23780 [Anaerolineae bacterium]|nr:hypothetical protein [Anaerolineae bacterium]
MLPEDRRAWMVRLTDAGRDQFAAMAHVHEAWIVGLMDGLTVQEQQQLYGLLGRLKQTVRAATMME